MSYLRCEDVSVVLGGMSIVDHIRMEAQAGQFVGIIGPNGSGKSTLLKSIYRVLTPSSGAIYLTEERLSSYSYKASAKKMAVVSQHHHYNFDFTVTDVVLMGRAPHKKQMERDHAEDYEMVNRALYQVDMAGYKDRIFSTLSGGEQQRIILARALAQDTSCLILDEPTNHLDIKHQLAIMSLVKSLNITVVAAIHDLNMAWSYCDQIYALKNGAVMASGSPKEVLTPSIIREIYEVDAFIIEDPITAKTVIAF